MQEICDSLLYWTLSRYDPECIAYRQMSSEVYDRAVSVIGIVVPVGIYLLALVSIFMLMWCFVTVFCRGRKK